MIEAGVSHSLYNYLQNEMPHDCHMTQCPSHSALEEGLSRLARQPDTNPIGVVGDSDLEVKVQLWWCGAAPIRRATGVLTHGAVTVEAAFAG